MKFLDTISIPISSEMISRKTSSPTLSERRASRQLSNALFLLPSPFQPFFPRRSPLSISQSPTAGKESIRKKSMGSRAPTTTRLWLESREEKLFFLPAHGKKSWESNLEMDDAATLSARLLVGSPWRLHLPNREGEYFLKWMASPAIQTVQLSSHPKAWH